MIKLAMLLLLVFGLVGCAASPDIATYVQKNIYIITDGAVDVTYEANAEVNADAKLDGRITPTTTITPPLPF